MVTGRWWLGVTQMLGHTDVLWVSCAGAGWITGRKERVGLVLHEMMGWSTLGMMKSGAPGAGRRKAVSGPHPGSARESLGEIFRLLLWRFRLSGS